MSPEPQVFDFGRVICGPGESVRMNITHIPTGLSAGGASFSLPHLKQQLLDEIEALLFINTNY